MKGTGNRVLLTAVFAAFAAVAAFGDALSPDDFGCIDAREVVKAGGNLELGQWYIDWATCKKYVEDHKLPALFIWSNKSCIHCKYTDLVFVQDAFKKWAAENNAGKVIYCFMAGGEKKYPDWQEDSTATKWMYRSDLPASQQLYAYPYVCLYWPDKGIRKNWTGDDFCSGNATGTKFNAKTHLNIESMPDRIPNVIEKMESTFKGWNPVTYAGGNFRAATLHDRLEAEKTTTTVSIDVTREATAAMSQTLRISAPGKTTKTQTISWAKDERKKTITLSAFNTTWFAEGKAVTLELLDGGKVMSATTITCVTPANSAANPDFTGFPGWGKWTMDLAAAKAEVAKTGGDNVWTLVCVQGSLWCPDCGRVETNFLSDSKVAKWATSDGKKVAFVAIDIPNYNSTSATAASPCLLKKDAYSTNPESAAAATPHSGLGYLTRKMAKDAKIAEYLSRNHDLASKMTSAGGFHRPEERDYQGNRANRCGAPIFVLLDKNGKVRAEFVRLAEDSPTDRTNTDNYLKRFDEMIDIAKNNATEIENNYASSGSVEFSANGEEKARLCNADMYDTFKVGGNARQKVVVKGDSVAGFDDDCAVTVEFQKLENGKAVTLGTAKSGTLKAGVTQEYTFTSGGTYYVQVRGWGPKADTDSRKKGYDSSAFAAKSPKAKHFQNYTITLTTILVPQEDEATYAYAAETKKVSMELKKGTVYRITGMGTVCAKLESKGGDLYTAKETCSAEITLPGQAGQLVYQIWKPGTLGFAKTSQTVARDICDADPAQGGLGGKPLAIKIARSNGKSGPVSATVTIDPEGTYLDNPKRCWLCSGNDKKAAVGQINLKWTDGDAAEKTAYIYIQEDTEWDGNGTVILRVTSANGVTADRGTFRLSIQSDVIKNPGKAVVIRAEPELASKKIYARAETGAKIWFGRTDGTDGLVDGVLQSSIRGVTFKTENPRDLEDISTLPANLVKKYSKYGDEKVLYWSSGEGGEKYVQVTGVPAGETAKITFTPIGNLKGGKSTITLISVAKDAPYFEAEAVALDNLYRYQAVSRQLKVLETKGGKVQLKKLSGKIPSGLKVSYDETAKTMALSGIPTKADSCSAIYQVIETRSGKKVEGLTVALSFVVTDVAKEGPGGEPAINPSVAKSRTLKNIAVFDSDQATRLVGLLQLTVPPTGKLSAKFASFDGTTSFSAKSWSGVNSRSGTLQSALVDKKSDRTLNVEVAYDGNIGVTFAGTGINGFVAWTEGEAWSKTNPATGWEGYYTVALRNKEIISEGTKGIAPTGDGYLTLKMASSSDINSGTLKVAGKLPNGTSVSCSSVLMAPTKNGRGKTVAVLPIFKISGKEVFSAAPSILANAQEEGERRCIETEDIQGYWRHAEKKVETSYEVGFGAYGSYYDKDEDLGGCCAEYFGKTDLAFAVEGTDIADIKVTSDKITVSDAKGSKLTCSLTRATGVVTGKFIHPILGTKVSYVGIVVNGWGDGCGCGNYRVYLPFVSGSYQYTAGGLKLGGAIDIK